MRKIFIMLAMAAMVFTGCHKDNENNGGGNDPTVTTYTVTFDANGGSGTMQPQTFTEGEAMALNANTFVRVSHVFVGWNTASDGTGAAYADTQETTVSGDMTLYAQWEKAVFSVSGTKKVYFSQGNLQYQASTNTWRFAEHQWDYVGCQNPVSGIAGGTVSGSDNANISSSYSGWIDLFGWGTGNNPTSSSQNNNDYSSFTDWGTNPISNGGNLANQWRTLTNNEWSFLMYNRTTSSGIRYAKATVNGVAGVIILPDDWRISYYALVSPNSSGASFSANTITSSNWTSKFEAHGAVFLPAAGGRNGTSVYDVGTGGGYWSSTSAGWDLAYYLYFYGGSLYCDGCCYYWYSGQSVRLVVEE